MIHGSKFFPTSRTLRKRSLKLMKTSIPRRLRSPRAFFTIRIFLIVAIVVVTGLFVRNNVSHSSAPPAPLEVANRYAQLEMSFERNEGQTDRQVRFLARGRGYDLFLTTADVVLTLSNASVLRLSMVGANRASSIEGEDELPGKVNYLLGDQPGQWRTNISTYKKVRYREVYPGVDVVYYGNQRQLEYDFIVAAGRDPGVIKFKLAGADRIRLDESGDLRLSVKNSEVRLQKPFIYQLTDTGERSEVKGEYVVKGKEIGFKVRAFDSRKPLVIDPVLSYATLLGANGADQGNGIAVDAQGNAYVTGVTSSATFPVTPGAFQTTPGFAFVTKIDATGSNLIYSTYLGDNETTATAIAVDSSGSAYITGSAFSDAFVTKLNPSGSGITLSLQLGGDRDDAGNAIALDGSGNIYVAGLTTSTNFPAVNAIKPAFGVDTCVEDGFVTKISPTPSIVFSTYLGGDQCDQVTAVATDSSGNVYLTGHTTSSNFPLANAFQTAIGDQSGRDAFATKLSGSGSLVYSTYLGGNNIDSGRGIAVDASGNAYITGATTSTNFPTANAIQPARGADLGGDAFVTKLNSTGSGLAYSTYLGGSNSDVGRAIAVDTTGNAYVTGSTFSTDFPLVPGALRTKSPLFRSTDGAANWNNDTFGFRGPFISDIAVDPVQPSIVYAATASGVFKSTNGGKTWSAINNGLPVLFANKVVVDPATPSRIYTIIIGPNGGVYRSLDSGNTWTRASNGIANITLAALTIDPVNPATLYVGKLGPGIYKTTNGADSWTLVGAPAIGNSNAIAVDPFNHTTIYATDFNTVTGGIFRSTDAGITWARIGFNQVGADGNFVGLSPLTPGFMYAVTDSGVFKSVDGGTDWTLVRIPGGRVVFDPVNPATHYLLSFSEGLLKSSDNGQTWVLMNKGLGEAIPNALAIDPVNSSNLYLSNFSDSDSDVFVTKINPAGGALVYSTFLGGALTGGGLNAGFDEGAAIAIDPSGNAYVAGTTNSPNFMTTPGAYQPINLGSADVFIAKLATSHLISGRVLNTNNEPLSGAEVVLSDGASFMSVFTDSFGYYEFLRLREGGSFTVSANKPNFTMAPPGQTFNNLTGNQVLNFTATPTASAFFTVSGRVTENGVGLPGITITLTGSQQSVRTTDTNGNYSFTLPGGGNYTVTPSFAFLGFTLSSQTFVNLSANQTANFTAARQGILVTNKNNHGPGSFRQALLDANATPGKDTIIFNIPGDEVQTIDLIVGLPIITDPVIIDATPEQGEFAPTPRVELNGAATGGAIGLLIRAGDTTVRGLAMGGFTIAIAAFECNNNIIQGNHIGLDWSGTAGRPNGTGILLSGSSNNLIGGTSPEARNVISANHFEGLSVIGNNNLVQGNWIGPNTAGRAGFGNGSAGIIVGGISIFPPTLDTSDNVIGGTTPGAGNVIAYNNAPGVTVGTGTRNTIRRNSIFSNNSLGIDLLWDNVTANDLGDLDTGANLLQNFPVLTSVVSDGANTTMQGFLNSTPNTTFQIDFYSNGACDVSGNGEGETVFNAFNNNTTVTTNASGNATINVTFPIALPAGRVLTATATDPQGNTSEFSPCDASNVRGSAEFSVSSRTVIEDAGAISVTVLRKGGSFGSLSVDYFTLEGAATAGQDYTTVSGTLVFNHGETSKNFQIPIINDNTLEQDETFSVFLNAPGASVGVPGLQTITLQDRNTVPSLSIEGPSHSAFVTEGDSDTTDAVFTVSLSAETGRSVSVEFGTVIGRIPGLLFQATAGAACGPFVDFETKIGTLIFQPGEVAKTVVVKICGDTNAERHEDVLLDIANPSNATLLSSRAVIAIANDDELFLALDESGPAPDQAAAIESHLVMRDPFRVLNIAEWLQLGSDRNTRVTLFATGLELTQGEPASTVIINLTASNGQGLIIFAEDVRPLPGLPFTQVTFRVPDNSPAGNYQVSISVHGHTSNTGTIRIAP